MIKFPYKKRYYISLPYIVFFLLFLPGLIFAADKISLPKKEEAPEKTHITSDMLVIDINSDKAEFIGNVKVIQGTTVITSDKLDVFYQKNAVDTKDNDKNNESIKEIIATGNVTILFDDKIAKTQHAVYTADNGVFTLTGKGSKIKSGNNSISGSKITFFRDDGHVKIESNRSDRVEAILESANKGI